jgi:hypothetical protein
MKVSHLLAVALLTVGCGDSARSRAAEDLSESAATGTTGATVEHTPPQVEGVTVPQPAEKTPSISSAPPAPLVAPQARAKGVNPHAAVQGDFKERVDAYMKVRKDAVKDAPKLKETTDTAQLKAAQDAMAAHIRAARANARQGDVFTPEIVAQFRRLLYPELKGDDGRDAKEILKDDAPPTQSIPFKVNAKYPDNATVPTVPANLLLNLPTLPEPLQYKIIGKHLILLDEDADLIVDYATNVIS